MWDYGVKPAFSSIVGGAKALQGEDWRNPVTRVLKLQVLSEK